MNTLSMQRRKQANRVTIFTVCFIVLFSLAFMIFAKEKASANNATVITSVSELQAIGEDEPSLGKDYELGNDIDLSGIEWEGIGEQNISKRFKGTFDGKGHTIKNLTTSENNSALFTATEGATVKNVNFTNVNISKSHSSNTAAIVGHMNSTTIENVNVDGYLKGSGVVGAVAAGGISGKIVNAHVDVEIVAGAYTGGSAGAITGEASVTIEDSSAKGTVSSQARFVGGLAGEARNVINSHSSVDVTSTYTGETNPANVGGLVGHIQAGEIIDSYATGNVKASNDHIGGLVGNARGGDATQIKNSYATGNVEGRHNVGGLVGYHDSQRGHEIHDSYSKGEVKGQNNVGGLVGLQANERADRADSKAMLISKSYSESNVQASGEGTNVGGLIGKIESNDLSRVEDAYARGTVTGKDNVGGFIGLNEKATIDRAYATGTVLSDSGSGGVVGKDTNGVYSDTTAPNFYDKDTTNMSDSKGATGEITAAMQNRPTFTGWNFTTTWKMNPNDYPTLRDAPFDVLTDIPSSYWGRDDVTEIVETDIMQGSEDGGSAGKFIFRPADDITRAEFAIVIINALGVDATNSSTGFNDDSSVPAWAKQEVAKAKELEIVEGDEDGNFNPSNKISRAEIATMIARAYELPLEGFGGPDLFEDSADIPNWAEDEVAAVVAQQIMQGQDQEGKLYFAPGSQAQRVEAGLSALRAYKLP